MATLTTKQIGRFYVAQAAGTIVKHIKAVTISARQDGLLYMAHGNTVAEAYKSLREKMAAEQPYLLPGCRIIENWNGLLKEDQVLINEATRCREIVVALLPRTGRALMMEM